VGSRSKNYSFRKSRVRRKVFGTPLRPRLSVYRSLKHIYAQVVDDASGKTLVSASSREAGEGAKGSGGNIDAAKKVGKLIAQKSIGASIKKVVFDRGGRVYHGRVKALADGAREAGLEF